MYFQYKHRIWSRDKELILGLTEKGFGHFFISTDEIRGHLYKKNWLATTKILYIITLYPKLTKLEARTIDREILLYQFCVN